MSGRVAILIVNYNAGDALLRCVESVLSQGRNLRVVVVDNHSGDGSAQDLQERYARRDEVLVRSNGENRGFAAAVNQAAGLVREGPERYVLVLNPDCELYPGALEKLMGVLDSHPGAAMAAPAVVDRGGVVMRGTWRRFPDPWRAFLTFSGLWRLGRWLPAFEGVERLGEAPYEVSEAEALSGACMLIRKDRFFEIGRMDEAYRLHGEDLDLMYRFAQAGMQRLFVPQAKVFHQQGLSSRSRPAWVHWQKHRGMQRFFSTHQAHRYGFPLRWGVIAGIWIRFLVTLPWVMIRR